MLGADTQKSSRKKQHAGEVNLTGMLFQLRLR
jgi:hypothetical protein